jgi:hypothetical protein
MKKIFLVILILIVSLAFVSTAKAEDRYAAANITVVAGTSSADRCLDKMIIWDIADRNAATGTTVTVCDLSNTWTAAAAANTKMKFFIAANREMPIVIEVITIINAATREAIWFDNGIRFDAGTNTLTATIITRRSSNGN